MNSWRGQRTKVEGQASDDWRPGSINKSSALQDEGKKKDIQMEDERDDYQFQERGGSQSHASFVKKDIIPDDFIPDAEVARFKEEFRQIESVRGVLLETINLLWRECHVKYLKFFRMRVEDAKTMKELEIAANMLMTIGRFQEVSGGSGNSQQ